MRSKEMEITDELQGQSEKTPSRRENRQMLPTLLLKASQQRESYPLQVQPQTGEHVFAQVMMCS